MSYEFDYQLLETLTDSYGLLVDLDELDDMGYPAQIAGMRALDYDPDLDDYEYQQSRY